MQWCGSRIYKNRPAKVILAVRSYPGTHFQVIRAVGGAYSAPPKILATGGALPEVRLSSADASILGLELAWATWYSSGVQPIPHKIPYAFIQSFIQFR